MSKQKYITLKDGTEVPADDFWLYAPMWLIMKVSEPVCIPRKKPRVRVKAYSVPSQKTFDPRDAGFSLEDDGRICRDDDPDCRHPLCDCARYVAEQRGVSFSSHQRQTQGE